MVHRKRIALAAVAAALVLSACGSSSTQSLDASTLLKQTFSGSHPVHSGNLTFTVAVTPSGSSSLSGPIVLSFGGPFQSRGAGKLPESDFKVSVSAMGRSGSLGILSTGNAGYVSLDGTSYQLPAATFQKVESSFGQIASGSGTSGSQSTLSKLGINPLNWAIDPTVVGTATVGGTDTTHIHAGVNVNAFLADLNTLLSKAGSLGVSGASKIPTSISPATRQKIASEIKTPSFDVWTGNGDKTVRKLAINMTVPVSGKVSTSLGGLSSAAIGLTLQYGQLNQPQTITAPATVHPYSEFEAKTKQFLQEIEGAVSTGGASVAGGGTTTTGGASVAGGGTTTTGNSGSSASKAATAYSKCIQAAGGDVTKMQKCSSLLTSGG
jgi:hypothetical protein